MHYFPVFSVEEPVSNTYLRSRCLLCFRVCVSATPRVLLLNLHSSSSDLKVSPQTALPTSPQVQYITNTTRRIAIARIKADKAEAALATVQEEEGEDGEETAETTEEKAKSLSVVTTKGDDDDDDEYADVEGVVGMVGYPNVGKSSIINVLMGTTAAMHGSTRVRVSATPGKTKHFQTIVRRPRS